MRLYDLCAINTYFQPRRNNNTTFIAASRSSHYQHVGRQVSTKYRGIDYRGEVKGITSVGNKKVWAVQFEDGYLTNCSENQLQKWLLPLERNKAVSKQIDYVMVSNRWRSCVSNSRTHWGPAIHGNKHGRVDHALVSCAWKWRVRVCKTKPKVDWSSLRWPESLTEGEPAPSVKFATALSTSLENSCADLETDVQPSSADIYDNLCSAVHNVAKAVLPVKQSMAMSERNVSARSKLLYKEREKMNKRKIRKQNSKTSSAG